MKFSLLPRIIVPALTDVTEELLHSHGIKLLMLDFDNTIVPYTTDVPSPEIGAWLESMKTSDIQICVVSNSRKDRVKIFCEAWGIPCITRALKPMGRGIRQCLERFGVPAEQAALAGDQIYTDTLGGNLCGVTTILVTPICNHHILLKLRHLAELPFIYLARKRSIPYEES